MEKDKEMECLLLGLIDHMLDFYVVVLYCTHKIYKYNIVIKSSKNHKFN